MKLRRKRRGLVEPSVTHASESKRYEISVDGVTAGCARYLDRRNQRIFYRTEVDDKFAGHGLAGKLIAAALDDTRTAGSRIVAICPLVAAYVDKYEEYDVVDPITPQAHAAVRAAISDTNKA